jgi:hypothetical protein
MNNRTLRILVGIWVVLLFLCYVGAMWNMSDSIVREQKLEIQRLTSENDSPRIASDSLYSENFPCQVELGRYQVAYEIFMERNPKGAKQYGTIISEETE